MSMCMSVRDLVVERGRVFGERGWMEGLRYRGAMEGLPDVSRPPLPPSALSSSGRLTYHKTKDVHRRELGSRIPSEILDTVSGFVSLALASHCLLGISAKVRSWGAGQSFRCGFTRNEGVCDPKGHTIMHHTDRLLRERG